MGTHRDRLADEKAELDGKIERLISFIGGEAFPHLQLVDRHDLDLQLGVMRLYSTLLGNRLSRLS